MAKLFETTKTSSTKTALFRRLMNLFPSYFGSGGRVKFVSADWKEAHVAIRLSWRTRNYVGSIFGGSLYASADPMLMIQLMQILGKDYIVWDKSAAIKFKRPAKGRLRMRFTVSEEMIQHIQKEVLEKGEYSFLKQFEWIGKDNRVFAVVEKELYVANKSFYKTKIALRNKDNE